MLIERPRREIANEVYYEWTMLCWTFEKLRKRIGKVVQHENGKPFLAVTYWYGTCLEDREGSAMIEPFLLHARNLRDFFYLDTSKHEDDVLAVHFFDDPAEWTTIRPEMGRYIRSIRGRLNKALAHISYARIGYRTADRWKVGQIKRDLTAPWEAFLNALTPEMRRWFRAPS